MFLVFQGQFRNKVNFLGYYCKLFLYNISFFKPLTHTYMSLRNFLLCFAEFFSQIGWEEMGPLGQWFDPAGKPR